MGLEPDFSRRYVNLEENAGTHYYSMAFLQFLHRVSAHENLNRDDAREAMSLVLDGAATTAQIAAFLVALKMKGETAEEVLGFASAMRDRVAAVDVPSEGGAPLIDTCGTGGDPLGTFNISTVAAFVAAGAGIRVAKHGNRSLSSKCGSADVLEALGARIDLTPQQVGEAIQTIGIGFLFAPAHHPAMRHAQPARSELKMRTVFNLLGPLTNPAGARRQLIGASSAEAAELIAQALAGLGTDHAYVVNGFDGLDEVSTTGPTMVYEIRESKIDKHLWAPADFGVPRAMPDDLRGGDPEVNRTIARRVLDGEKGPARDIVVVNAAVALMAADWTENLKSAVAIASESIDQGSEKRKMDQLIEFSRQRQSRGSLIS
jgi:anthranilate phosphoribosyltransferase